jgi:hypothetical protein
MLKAKLNPVTEVLSRDNTLWSNLMAQSELLTTPLMMSMDSTLLFQNLHQQSTMLLQSLNKLLLMHQLTTALLWLTQPLWLTPHTLLILTLTIIKQTSYKVLSS